MVSRGDEISLPAGTVVEMVLKRELQLDHATPDVQPAPSSQVRGKL
jgi:hypothetical protein